MEIVWHRRGMTKLKRTERAIRTERDAPSTSPELKAAIEAFLAMDVETARDDTATLEQLFSNRFFAREEDVAMPRGPGSGAERIKLSVPSPDTQSLVQVRCERATDRILHLLKTLEAENVHPYMPALTLVAVVRAFLCKSVADYGFQGIEDARVIFHTVVEDLTPMLRAATS